MLSVCKELIILGSKVIAVDILLNLNKCLKALVIVATYVIEWVVNRSISIFARA